MSDLGRQFPRIAAGLVVAALSAQSPALTRVKQAPSQEFAFDVNAVCLGVSDNARDVARIRDQGTTKDKFLADMRKKTHSPMHLGYIRHLADTIWSKEAEGLTPDEVAEETLQQCLRGPSV